MLAAAAAAARAARRCPRVRGWQLRAPAPTTPPAARLAQQHARAAVQQQAPVASRVAPPPGGTSPLAGVAAAAGVWLAADALAGAAPDALPLSGVPVAIAMGAALRHAALRTPARAAAVAPGLALLKARALPAGIVCVGAKLSLADAAAAGAAGLPAVLASMGVGLTVIPAIARYAGLAPRLGALLAVGTSVCGVTAVSALAPVIAATEAEVALAVANVVAWGSAGMLLYPAMAHALCETSEQAGVFLGLAIHDTAQVMGAGLAYERTYGDEEAFKTAAITKLMRNGFLAAALPAMAISVGGGKPSVSALRKAVPAFVLAFMAAALLRSAGDATASSGTMSPDACAAWKKATSFVGGTLASNLLGVAMAGLGLSISASVFKGVGLAPLAVGAAGALAVSTTAAASSTALLAVGVLPPPREAGREPA